MSRLSLAGYGAPIPSISLPDPNTSGERPAIELVLENGVPFLKADYVSLGYTHFEVWCVGGAGGLGGGVALRVEWQNTLTWGQMPDDVWNARKQLATIYGGQVFVTGRWQRVPGQSFNGPWEELVPARWMTPAEAMEYTNPYHEAYYRTYIAPYLYKQDFTKGIGGGGGGGGSQKVFGELADLPDSVPVTIGLDGLDGAIGHDLVDGAYTPEPPFWSDRSHRILEGYGGPAWTNVPSEMALVTLINSWGTRWSGVPISLYPPSSGEDGEPTSFGEIAEASGGKGGGPAVIWEAGVKKQGRFGGDGGLGGTQEAGGGGGGSENYAAGLDGSWDGVIGGGGGGGRGGLYDTGIGTVRQATNGGRGAFSYLDTTVYGQRGYATTPENYEAQQEAHALVHEFSTPVGGRGTDFTKTKIVPGGGGGIRVARKRPVGSDADGYSPHGMVLLRLIKID